MRRFFEARLLSDEGVGMHKYPMEWAFLCLLHSLRAGIKNAWRCGGQYFDCCPNSFN